MKKGAAKRCETLGVAYEKFLLPADVKEEEVLKTISQVNKNDKFMAFCCSDLFRSI